MMLFIILIGYAARKLKFMDAQFTKKLSDVTLCVCQPFMIISAIINIEYSADKLKDGLTVLLICAIVHALSAVFAFLLTCRIKKVPTRRICEFAMIFGNCGFFGFPVYKAVFGDIGTFYGSFYVIGFNIIAWSYGVFIMMKGNPDAKVSAKSIFLNFGTVSSVIGILLFVLQIRFPEPILSAFDRIGGLCTPLSLMIVGSLLSTIPLKKLFTDIGVYFVSGIKLIVIPFIVSLLLLLLRPLGISDNLIIFGSVASAMPVASLTAMFGTKYNLEPDFAAHCACFATVLSAATIPLVSWFILAIR